MKHIIPKQIALIGGSGLTQIPDLVVKDRRTVETPYGLPSAEIVVGRLYSNSIFFLPRHGRIHSIPPHRINYRANLWALKQLGTTHIVALATVGGISAQSQCGGLVLPDQIIDYTWGREHTFYDSDRSQLQHIEFAYPYSQPLRNSLLQAAKSARVTLVDGGTYAATQGPRLESAAEIDRLENDGADMVGMTGMPETALARELGLQYACLALVVNPAAGRGDAITLEMIQSSFRKASKKVFLLSQYLKI